MRSRLYSALLLATATALLVGGAFVARTAHPLALAHHVAHHLANDVQSVAKPGTPAIQ